MPSPREHIYISTAPGRAGDVYRVLAWRGVYECSCPARVECHHIKEQRAEDEADRAYLEGISAMNTIEERGLVPAQAPSLGAALVTREQLNTYREIAKEAVAAVGMVPKGMTQEQAVAVVLAGHELGFPPFAALRLIFPVNGKMQVMTEGYLALVRDRDPSAHFTFHKAGDDGAEVELFRGGRSEIRVKYTDAERIRAHQGYKKKGVWTSSQNGQRYFKAELDGDGNPVWLEDPESIWNTHPTDMFLWAAIKRCIRFGAPDLSNLAPREVAYRVIDEASLPQGEVSKAVFGGSVDAAGLEPDFEDGNWADIDEPNDGIPPDNEAPQEAVATAPSPSPASSPEAEPGVTDVTQDLEAMRQTLETLLLDCKQTWGKDFAPLQAEMGQFNPDGQGIFNPRAVPESKAAAALAFLRRKRGEV